MSNTSNSNQPGNTKKTQKYIPSHIRNPSKAKPEKLLPLNLKSWKKRHYAVIDKDDFEYHYTPFQLTNAILSGLLNENMNFNNRSSKITFKEDGTVQFHNFPSLICNKVKKSHSYDPRALNSNKEQKTIKVKEIGYQKNDNGKVKVEFENLETEEHEHYQLTIDEEYMKQLINFLPRFIKKTNDTFELLNRSNNFEGLTRSFTTEAFKYVKSESQSQGDGRQFKIFSLQKYTLNKFLKVDGKDYLLFGYPDPHKMSYYYDNDLNTSINQNMIENIPKKLQNFRDFWNKFYKKDSDPISITENGELDWKMSDIEKNSSKEKEHLQLVFDNDEAKINNFHNIIKKKLNEIIQETFSRGDTRMKYIFTLFEIIKNPDGSFKLQSVLDRMKDIKEEHRELLNQVNISIINLLYNQTDFNFNLDKLRPDEIPNHDNLLIYCRNSGIFHFEVEYIDPLSNFDNYYYILNNITTITDLINLIGKIDEIELISYVNKKKLEPLPKKILQVSQQGGTRQEQSEKIKILGLFNYTKTKSKIILFNITSNKEITCVVKKGDKYFLIKLYPKLTLLIKDNKYGKSIIFQHSNDEETYYVDSDFKSYEYDIFELTIENIKTFKISIKPAVKGTFLKVHKLFSQKIIKFKDFDETFKNPYYYIPYYGKNAMYSVLYYLITNQFKKQELPPNSQYNDNNFNILKYNSLEKPNEIRTQSNTLFKDSFYIAILKNFDYIIICKKDKKEAVISKEKDFQLKYVLWVIPKPNPNIFLKNDDDNNANDANNANNANDIPLLRNDNISNNIELTIEHFMNIPERSQLKPTDLVYNNKNIAKINKYYFKKLTIDEEPKYLFNIYTIKPDDLEKLKNILDIMKKIVMRENNIKNNNDLIYYNHLFYAFGQGCFHIHLGLNVKYDAPGSDEKLISRMNRTFLFDKYYNLQKYRYYSNENINLSFFHYLYYHLIMMEELEYTEELQLIQLQNGGEKLEIEEKKKKISISNLINLIKKNSLENHIFNIYKNISSFFTIFYNQNYKMNISTIINTNFLIEEYFNLKKNNNILIITNVFSHLIPILNNKKLLNDKFIEIYLYFNQDIIDIDNQQYLNYLKKNNINFKGDFKTKLNIYNDNNFEKDLIILRNAHDNLLNNIKCLLISLINLKENGTLISFMDIDTINYSKFYLILIKSFKKINIYSYNFTDYLSHEKKKKYVFTGYNKISIEELEELKTLILNLENDNNTKELKLTNIFNFTKKDIEKGDEFISQNNKLLNDYTEKINDLYLFFQTDQENYIKYVARILITLINTSINYLNENKIPYNKYYLSYINDYYQENLNEIFSLGSTISQKIIKYKYLSTSYKKSNIKSKLNFKKNIKSHKKNYHKSHKKDLQSHKSDLSSISRNKEYTYDYFDNVINSLGIVKKLRSEITETHGYQYLNKVSKIAEDFTKGLPAYLYTKFDLPYHPSNAFTKMWEILETFNLFEKRKNKTFKTFHFAEAPGQFIWATSYFIKKNFGSESNIEWLANSLNPKNPKNIAEYGNGIFSDDYGFMKKYRERWLFGEDDTGNITDPKNIMHFRNKFKNSLPSSSLDGDKEKVNEKVKVKENLIENEIYNFDIVTGDAGLSNDMGTLFLQKLEFAQVCMVAATASLGKSCVVKHFTPFLNSQEETDLGGGQFVSMIYLYSLMFENVHLFKPYTSRPSSGEFYVIGKGFLGVSDTELKKILSLLDNFTVNQSCFSKNKIPEYFVRQVFSFIDKMSNLNIQIIERQNFFMTCLIDPNEELRKHTKCLEYIEPKNLDKIHKSRFDEWIQMYNFS